MLGKNNLIKSFELFLSSFTTNSPKNLKIDKLNHVKIRKTKVHS